jgi:competence protein ComEC
MLIIGSVIWFKKPNYSRLVFTLTTIILIQISFIYTKKELENQQEMIVYNLKKKTLITERSGKSIKLFATDTVLLHNPKNYVLNSYLVGNFGTLKSAETIKNTLFFKGKKIAIIDSTGIYQNKIQPDIVLLTQSPKINLDRVLNDLHPEIIIADGSNSYAIQKNWKKTCDKKNILFHSTSEKGYYKLN